RIRLWGIRWAARGAAAVVGRAIGAVGAAGAGGVAGLITGAWAGVDAGGVAVPPAVAAGAGAWTGEPDRYASMSRRMIRPPGPVPRIRFRSSRDDSAILRASGLALRRPP